MVFELLNKVIFPRSKKRTIASIVDLFMIEFLSKFKLISLPSLMIEHRNKVIHENQERHGMSYGQFLNMVFDQFGVIMTKRNPGTVKQRFTLTTLVEINA